jgi:hypothetical protein
MAGASYAACGGESCVVPPCAPPLAVTLTLKSAGGNPIAGAYLKTADGSSRPCNAGCAIAGYRGSYTFEVGAPGYQTVTKTVDVTGKDAEDCGCPRVDTQQLTITLLPTP